MTYLPQLATAGPATDEQARYLAGNGYVFDMKWDGVRAIAVVQDTVKLLNRKGEDFAYRYPEVCRGLLALYQQHAKAASDVLVLDGEIVCFDPLTGRPQFGLTGQRSFGPGRLRDIEAAALRTPGTFIAFDVLAWGGDMRNWTQAARFEMLDSLIPATMGPDARVVRSIRGTDGVLMLNVVREQRLEGLIAKDLRAPYKAGRRSSWIKMKPTRTCTALVVGWEPGEGKRADTFGALHLAVLSEAGERVDIGKVGTGFSDAELAAIDPFVRAGQEFLVEVEYLDRQPKTGVLRFPVFLGVRWDIDRDAASVAQLPEIPA